MKKNIEAAQEYYETKHGSSSTGSLVWKKDFIRKKRCGGKLDYEWGAIGKGLFRLQEKRYIIKF